MIGSVFAWILGLGALFLSIFTTTQSGSGATGGNAGVDVLFGSILGLSSGQALGDAVVALAIVAVFILIGRPLVFASLDPSVAAARGVPVRALDYAFFILLGITAGVATQAVGIPATPRSTWKPFFSRIAVRYLEVSNSWKPSSLKLKT